MENSLLLDALLKNAKQSFEKDNKRCILADYFVETLMTALRFYELGQLQEFLKTVTVDNDTLAELESTIKLLVVGDRSFSELADQIGEFIRVDRPKTLAGALLFNKIQSDAKNFFEDLIGEALIKEKNRKPIYVTGALDVAVKKRK